MDLYVKDMDRKLNHELQLIDLGEATFVQILHFTDPRLQSSPVYNDSHKHIRILLISLPLFPKSSVPRKAEQSG